MLILGAREIDELLPMPQCIEAMEQAMCAVSAGHSEVPPRTAMAMDEGAWYFQMPGAATELPVFGSKIVSLYPDNPAGGRPAVQGFVTLFDKHSGEPVALLEGARITALRTAAASALATRVLALPKAGSLGIFGNGVLAESHIEAITHVRNLEQVVVWGRDAAKVERFAARQGETSGLPVHAASRPEAAAACDIVCLLTNSPTPLLQGRWLKDGAHVNLVGAHRPDRREADSETLSRAKIFVDWRPGALREAGDILIPISEGRLSERALAGEIGEVLNGAVQGRTHSEEITLYKSLGVVTQDLFAAAHVYREALSRGAGQQVSLA